MSMGTFLVKCVYNNASGPGVQIFNLKISAVYACIGKVMQT